MTYVLVFITQSQSDGARSVKRPKVQRRPNRYGTPGRAVGTPNRRAAPSRVVRVS